MSDSERPGININFGLGKLFEKFNSGHLYLIACALVLFGLCALLVAAAHYGEKLGFFSGTQKAQAASIKEPTVAELTCFVCRLHKSADSICVASSCIGQYTTSIDGKPFIIKVAADKPSKPSILPHGPLPAKKRKKVSVVAQTSNDENISVSKAQVSNEVDWSEASNFEVIGAYDMIGKKDKKIDDEFLRAISNAAASASLKDSYIVPVNSKQIDEAMPLKLME